MTHEDLPLGRLPAGALASLITILVVPRETFSPTRRTMERLFACTDPAIPMICFDGGSPPEVRDYLVAAARQMNFTLLRCERLVTPNEARNVLWKMATTKYVVFVDNDVLVSEDWLEPLVRCAEETGAWAVGPLYCEHLPERTQVHCAGGEGHIRIRPDGSRGRHEVHLHAGKKLSDLPPFTRGETEMLEFHTMLVAREALEAMGGLDEGLTCVHEHWDLCVKIRARGHKVLFEPQSVITYAPPKSMTTADLHYLNARWSEERIRETMARLCESHGIAPGDRKNLQDIAWLRAHRRYKMLRWNRLRHRFGRLWRVTDREIVQRAEALVNRLTVKADRRPLEVTVVHRAGGGAPTA